MPHNSSIFKQVSSRLKNDREVAIAAIDSQSFNRSIIPHLSDLLKDDEEVMLRAIKRDDKSFQYASSRLKFYLALTLRGQVHLIRR